MLTLSVKTKLLVFVVVGVLAIGYLGVKYVGIGLFSSDYRVTVSLPKAGGLFENGEVTYRGVAVGRIEDLKPTRDGVDAVLRIEEDAPAIPADVTVTVANRSAIGEQYLDLRGGDPGDDRLADGDHIDGSAGSLPPRISELLRSGRDFLDSVPRGALKTVIDETYELTRDGARPLRRLNGTLSEFADTAQRNFLVTSGLIRNSGRVLDTQLASADSIRSFSRDLRLFTETLESSDADFRRLIRSTPRAARELGRLIDDVGGPLGVLMANLVSTARVFGVNAAGVESTMINLPDALSIGWSTSTSKGINLGLAQTYFDPWPCTTGYGKTTVREGLETSEGPSFNTEAGCTLAPSSGVNVRGPGSVTGAPRARVTVPRTMADLMGG